MMKKLLGSAFAVSILCGGFFAVTSAHTNNDCKEVQFSNGTVCVSINKVSSDRFELITDTTDGSIGTLRCDIMTPDSSLKSIPACNGNFTFDDNKSGRIKLRIRADEAAPIDWTDKPNNSSTRTYPQWMYDFSNESWMDSNNNGSSSNNNNSSNGDLNNFYLTTDNSSPSTYNYVDLNIKARDSSNVTLSDFSDTVKFKVYYGNANSSSWTQTTSSSYYAMASDYNSNGYDFTSSDDGYANLSNFIEFKNSSYDYKVRVYDVNDTSIYKDIIFYVNGSNSNNNNNNSNGDLNNFYLTTDNSSPSTYNYVDLNIKARDSSNVTLSDFSDTVKFKVYYGNANSSSWTQTTSSSYYAMASDYNSNGYDFNSSDNGYANLSNFIEFKNSSYDYKVRVYDVNDTSIYKDIIFYVNGSNSNNNNNSNGDLNNFYLTTDNSSPSTYNYVDLNIKARDSSNVTLSDFSDTVKFKVYYGNANSSSWTQTTSSSYYAMASDYNSYGYDFNSSDNGYANLSNFIEFKNSSYDYKVRVYDVNDTSIYKDIIFYVNGSNSNNNNNSNGDLNNFYLTTDNSSPSTYSYVDLNIKARDSSNVTLSDFSDTVKFKVYYGNASSSSWTQTTSSSYYAMASDYNSYGYDFNSSDNGYANLSNFIEFKNSSYDYKVRVYDVNDTSIYKDIIFYVNGSNSNNNNNSNGNLNNFYLTTDDNSPSTYSYVDLNIKARDSDSSTITNFSDTVKFKVYYGHADSSSWTQTTSSSYYAMASDYNSYGYDFNSSDNGYANLSNFIEFKNSSYDYKVRVYDVNDTSIYKDIIFYVNGSSSSSNSSNSSNVNGFSSTELDTVQSMYNARPGMISDLKAQYSNLRNNTAWKNRSNTFYNDMSDIIDDASSRTYTTYDEYYSAFLSWYDYTISVR